MYLNRLTLIGNVANDLELKMSQSGTQHLRLNLATNRVIKYKDGTTETEAQFHPCVAFGKLAELIKDKLSKGDKCFIEGRMEHGEHEGKKTSTCIIQDFCVFGKKDQNKIYKQDSSFGKTPDMGEINTEDVPF